MIVTFSDSVYMREMVSRKSKTTGFINQSGNVTTVIVKLLR